MIVGYKINFLNNDGERDGGTVHGITSGETIGDAVNSLYEWFSANRYIDTIILTPCEKVIEENEFNNIFNDLDKA